MPNVPAFCENCKTLVPSPFNLGGNMHYVEFQGELVVKCPRCNKAARIPDGVYSAIGATALAYHKGEVTEEQLRRLTKIVEDARTHNTESEEVIQRIRTEVPELRHVAEEAPAKERKSIVAYLQLFVSMMALVVQLSSPSGTITEEGLRTIINQCMDRVSQGHAPKVVDNPKKTPGPNARCACGSGKKYKKCCGVLHRR